MKLILLVWLLSLVTANVSAGDRRVPYATLPDSCDGYPRLDIGMADGFCAGLVAGPTRGASQRPMVLPRMLLQLDATTWLVTDLGGWDGTRGKVWKLETQRGKATILKPLIADLVMPHAIARGPDGLVYVGEMSRIFRFDPSAPDPEASIQPVVAGLPDNRLHENRHPLSKFVFASDGALLVNVGAPSDQCLDAGGQPLGRTCPQSEQGERAASIRRYPLIGPATWSDAFTVYATGLRNSVALAVHPSGTVLQGENSYDFEQRWVPFDEINRIEAGHHYGWPYCADMTTPAPGWKATGAMNCKSSAHASPTMLLPPHAAPLDMLWYDGAMFPSLKGTLLMTWHGYRSVGGRIVAFATDDDGVPVVQQRANFPVYGGKARRYPAGPSATARVLTPGWNLVAGRRPQGSPVGLAVASDGAIWTTDDRAGLVIRIAAEPTLHTH